MIKTIIQLNEWYHKANICGTITQVKKSKMARTQNFPHDPNLINPVTIQVFFSLSLDLFFFLFFSRSSFYIMLIGPLLIHVTHDSFLSLTCLFILFVLSFNEQKFKILISVFRSVSLRWQLFGSCLRYPSLL